MEPSETRLTKLHELNLQLALNWLVDVHTSKNRWVVAASFGALLATKIIIRRPEITNYVLLAPVITRTSLAEIELLTRLKTKGIIVIAERDPVTPVSKVWQSMLFVNELDASMAEFAIVKRADHFFSNKLKAVSSLVTSFFFKNKQEC
ncbi:MAG: hypothetical protein AAJB65_00420 [Candidatus Hodgkinia cicadicola]